MSAQLFNDSFSNFPKITVPQTEVKVIRDRNFSVTEIKPYLMVATVFGLSLSIWFGLPELSFQARAAFIVFGLAILLWSFTKLNDTYIALAAALLMALTNGVEPQKFFATLGDSTIWLMLASFIIAAGVTASGLADRLTKAIVAGVSTVGGLFYGLTAILALTAFIIPATSGRAALMLPVFVALSAKIADRRITIALSILFPAIILLSAIASLTGAGAHLVTADVLALAGGEKITFARWIMLGAPFATASCLLTTFVILRLFLNSDERRAKIRLDNLQIGENPTAVKWTTVEKFALGVTILLVGLWMTESLHGLNAALVALVGALVLTLPGIGPIKFKDAVKKINWNLLLFMAATLEMGEALIASGGAKWLVESGFATLQSYFSNSPSAIVTTVIIVSLLSHLVINSRTARSSVLIPMVVLLAFSMGLNATALAFVSTAAAGFCLTLTVSAKPVMMFSQHDGDTFTQNDLWRLSAVLLPLHLILLIIFAVFVYPLLGLELTSSEAFSNTLQAR